MNIKFVKMHGEYSSAQREFRLTRYKVIKECADNASLYPQ